ncbi:MAG: GNAT family N-acetyltransferase [Planctomycetaceae bacterium]|jgi:GNAT superfamily N-acetyltransferase|nr:GNAT family N-acetyltransferase [Planctomycetaceae bacterium]
MVNNCVKIRVASADDADLILQFIYELAEYEQLTDSVQITEPVLRDWITRGEIEVLIAEISGKPVGFALYYFTYSTFRGATGIYIEDLFIRPEFRRNGIGTMFFREIASRAKSRGCFKIDWMVLNWNEKSIEFYKKLGGRPIDDWTTYRLDVKQF